MTRIVKKPSNERNPRPRGDTSDGNNQLCICVDLRPSAVQLCFSGWVILGQLSHLDSVEQVLLVSRREPRRALQRRDPERGSVSRRTLAAAHASDYLGPDSDCDTGPIDQRCPMGMTAESRT